MSRIVYLFGAGASYGKRDDKDRDEIIEGLPIVSEFPKQIDRLIEKIQSEDTESKSQFKTDSQDLTKLINELRWLKETSESHQTVDTFAKKLRVTEGGNGPNYNRLKRALSVFLTLEQLFNKLDSRYDAFFANILGNSPHSFPKDVTILSWNYDCQFELAYNAFCNQNSIYGLWVHLNISAKTTKDDHDTNNNFSIVKLNGTALMFENRLFNSRLFDAFFDRQGMSEISYILNTYINSSKIHNALSFAWEGVDPDFYKNIQNKVTDAEILVIIGYSFPYFNREVDRRIIRNMPNLQKVYIQDPSCEDVKESFEATLSVEQLEKVENGQIKIVLKKSTQQFLIPNEM